MHSPRFGVYLCFSLAFGLAPLRAQDATKLPNIPKGLHLTTEDRSLWLTEIGDFILGGKTHMPSELRLEWAVLLFSLPECKRFLRPDARFLSLLPDAEKSPLLPGNTRWFYLALLSGPELRHRATGEPIGEKIDLKSEKSIDNVFFNEEGDLILVGRFFGGGLDYYAFPSGKHELSVRFESPAKFADAAPSGDLRKVAGRARFDPVVLDLTKMLGK